MDLSRLIAGLSEPEAYPQSVGLDDVEVHQTHISVVFLAGPYAYKVKKPVSLGFVDYSTLEARRHFGEEEVRVNRRLAPSVYLGVVPITCVGGRLHMEGAGEAVEWAVKMERLPDEARLREQILRGELDADQLTKLARRIAAFHARAERGPAISAGGSFAVVAANARDNFLQAQSQVGATLSGAVFDRLEALTERALDEHRTLIERRADRHVPCDGHGDLRLDHVYLFPDRRPPDDLVIIDAIEFNDRFRHADPIVDLAFLTMDLAAHGRRDLASLLAEAYVRAASDTEGRELLPFYASYRAAVRGKVEGMTLARPEIPASERDAALVKARARWLLALGELEAPECRPCLVLVGGLPGTGKSTLARGLAERAGFEVIRSDIVRKELARREGLDCGPSAFGEGIYTDEWTSRSYAECLRRAEAHLFEGRRVVVDASFRSEACRKPFFDVGACWAVPTVFFLCRADAEIVRGRLAGRQGDASDADWVIYQQAAARWEKPGTYAGGAMHTIDTGQSPPESLLQARGVLVEQALL
jgi:aminoglycoside phosphotransferase family enzyme/predicted kinase